MANHLSHAHTIYSYLLSFIAVFLCAPSLIYFTYQLDEYRSCMFLKKRFFKQIIIYTIAVVCFLILYIPMHSFTKWAIVHMSSSNYATFELISAIIYLTIGHGLAYLVFFRVYFVYFNTHLAVNTASDGWKQCINSNYTQSWFIVNRDTFGNTHFMSKRLFIAYIIGVLSTIIVYSFDGYSFIFNAVDSMFYSIPICGIFLCWKRTPQFHDAFGVRDEMRLLCFYSGSCIAVYFVSSITFAILGEHDEIKLDTFVTLAIIMFTGAGVIQTKGTLNKLTNNPKWKLDRRTAMSPRHSRSHQMMVLEILERSSNKSIQKNSMRLFHLLNTEYGYITFMAYLNSEFSMECLLSFTELWQFKYLCGECLGDIDDMNDRFVSSVGLPLVWNEDDLIPLSQSICQTLKVKCRNDLAIKKPISVESMFTIAQLLYQKYCVISAAFEVNISYGDRKKLKILFDKGCDCGNTDYQTLYDAFDNVLKEMYRLMDYSFTRFKTTQDWINIQSQFETEPIVANV